MRRYFLHTRQLATALLVSLSISAGAQAEQKAAKELLVGNWTLMIADNVSRDSNKVPGFGPLPQGTAKFGPDGHFSLEIRPTSGGQAALNYSGTYMLDDAGKAITLRVDDSSLPNWRGTTQTGTMKFVGSDHLGWTTSVPLVASGDFTGTELIWARAK
jgi:hypothetical protein